MREAYCKSVLGYMFSKQPISPEIFHLAFYFYGRLRLAKAVAKRMINSSRKEGEAKTKRTSNLTKFILYGRLWRPSNKYQRSQHYELTRIYSHNDCL